MGRQIETRARREGLLCILCYIVCLCTVKANAAFSLASSARRSLHSSHYLSSIRSKNVLWLSHSDDQVPDGELPSWWLPPNPETQQRKDRLAREARIYNRFSTGDELRKLQSSTSDLRRTLKWAEAAGNIDRVVELRSAIEEGEKMDPDLVYEKAMSSIENATKIMNPIERQEMIAKWSNEAAEAKSCIPRFNLEGLWCGNFGEEDTQLINVTYSGDVLIATIVTGWARGEICFEANLSPGKSDTDDQFSSPVTPIELEEGAASKWGVKQLPRYPGRGTLKNARVSDGQLVMFKNMFSFIWLDTKQHVFFTRPSARATIMMLRDIISKEDEVENMREHVSLCFKLHAGAVNPLENHSKDFETFRRIKTVKELTSTATDNHKEKDSYAQHSRFSLWQIKKWKNYILEALSDGEGNDDQFKNPGAGFHK